jgi:hypothetical protein
MILFQKNKGKNGLLFPKNKGDFAFYSPYFSLKIGSLALAQQLRPWFNK